LWYGVNSSVILTTMNNTRFSWNPQTHGLVLGGSGGIGAAVARDLVETGVKYVTITYGRNKDAALALKAELEAVEGVSVLALPYDRMSPEAMKQLLEDAFQHHKKEVSAFIDTVGISPNTPIEEQTVDEWAKVLSTNVIGSFVAFREVATRMSSRGVNGTAVIITSTNGVNSQASYSVHYDASKAAQAHMVRTLSEPFAKQGVRANCVAPGWVATSMNDTLPPGEQEAEEAKIWLGRFATPQEIARICTFLAAPDSSYIVGQNVMVDGGYR
jgi:NAD(P)-dependent dehydrogenase (short-subunit alcohol dehydrogenase family)